MMLRCFPLVALAAFGLTNAAQALDQHAMVFSCARDVDIPVIFLNETGEEGSSYAVAQIEGHLVPMEITRSGSGAKYSEGQGGYVLWNDGDTVSVFHGEDEAVIYQDCIVVEPVVEPDDSPKQ